MAKVKVKSVFHDLLENKLRAEGDVFECTNERANALNEKNLVDVLELDKQVEETRSKDIKPSHIKKK